MIKVPTIDDLNAMTDDELGAALGHDAAIKKIKKDIEGLAALEGKAREIAEERVKQQLSPHVSEYSFGYIKEDAERCAKKDGDNDGGAIASTCGCALGPC